MSVTLKRLETLRDESMKELSYHRELLNGYTEERATTLRWSVGWATVSVLGAITCAILITAWSILVFAALIILAMFFFTTDLYTNMMLIQRQRNVCKHTLDTVVERIAHVEDRKLLMLMDPDAAKALEDEGQRNEDEDRRIKAKREEERIQAKREREKRQRLGRSYRYFEGVSGKIYDVYD